MEYSAGLRDFIGRCAKQVTSVDAEFEGIAIARDADMMNTKPLACTCKWATQTLLTPWPLWLDAWTNEWSCTRDGALMPLAQLEHCRSCPRWEPAADRPRVSPPSA